MTEHRQAGAGGGAVLDPPGEAASAAAEPVSSGVDLRDAFYALGLVTLVVTVLTLASELLAPIAVSVLLWFLINAVATAFRRTPVVKHMLSDVAALVLATVLTLGAMGLAGQVVIANLAQLSDGLQNLDGRIAATIEGLERAVGYDLNIDMRRIMEGVSIEAVLGQIVSGVGQAASYFSLILLFVLFLLLDQPFYDAKIRALFPDGDRQVRVRRVLRKIGEDTRIYVWLMSVVSVFVGLTTYFLAAANGLQGAAFWGFLAFALNFIPTIGSFLGVIFPGVFAFVQFEEIEQTLVFVALLGVVQFIAGNIVLPRLMGDRLNLSQFVVILSLSIWGAMWGVSGLFLAVPLMMVLAIVLSQFASTRPVAILMSKTGKVMPAARTRR